CAGGRREFPEQGIWPAGRKGALARRSMRDVALSQPATAKPARPATLSGRKCSGPMVAAASRHLDRVHAYAVADDSVGGGRAGGPGAPLLFFGAQWRRRRAGQALLSLCRA